jgi:DNA-directed RNA polymerase subunit L
MSYIKNLIIDNDICLFDLDNSTNELKISFANALRRTFISNIETYIINPNNTIIYENNSIYSNEFLKHRLSLIPIISNIPDLKYENIVLTCKKNNTDEIIENILVSDFIVNNIEDNSIINNDTFFKFTSILLAKLKTNNFISFECKLTKNNAENGGSFFSPVCGCIYTFEIDTKEVENVTKNMSLKDKTSFNLEENERIYKKNKIGAPLIYKFNMEMTGSYDSKTTINMGISELINKLNITSSQFNNLDNSTKIRERSTNDEFYYFVIDEENETLGELLSTYIMDDERVFYCGYVIEHPLKKNILLKIKLKDDNFNDNIKNIILVITDKINYLIELLNKIMKDIK